MSFFLLMFSITLSYFIFDDISEYSIAPKLLIDFVSTKCFFFMNFKTTFYIQIICKHNIISLNLVLTRNKSNYLLINKTTKPVNPVIQMIPCNQVFSLTTHQLLHTFAGEHARSSFFKHIGQGVTQIHIGKKHFSTTDNQLTQSGVITFTFAV